MTKVNKPYKTLSFEVSLDVIRGIRHLAVDRDVSATTLYRQALEEFLERHSPAQGKTESAD